MTRFWSTKRVTHDQPLGCTVCGKPIEAGEGHYRAGVRGIHVTCEKFAKRPGLGALLSYRDSMTVTHSLWSTGRVAASRLARYLPANI